MINWIRIKDDIFFCFLLDLYTITSKYNKNKYSQKLSWNYTFYNLFTKQITLKKINKNSYYEFDIKKYLNVFVVFWLI